MAGRAQTADLRWTTDDNVPTDLYYFALAGAGTVPPVVITNTVPSTFPLTIQGAANQTTISVRSIGGAGQTGDLIRLITANGGVGGVSSLGVLYNQPAGADSPPEDLLLINSSATEDYIKLLNHSSGTDILMSPTGGGSIQLNVANSGSRLFSTTGVPSNALGSNGDFVFRGGSSGVVYSKEGGAWTQIAPTTVLAPVVYTAPVSGGFSASPPVSSTALGHGTSITVPASSSARSFAVWGFIVADGNNYSAQVILDGSTSIANSAGAYAVDANGFSQAVCIGLTTIPGDNATHTLALAWQSVSNTNSRSVNAATNLVAIG